MSRQTAKALPIRITVEIDGASLEVPRQDEFIAGVLALVPVLRWLSIRRAFKDVIAGNCGAEICSLRAMACGFCGLMAAARSQANGEK
jgi:hypothetical protein